jgi:hypothetical protein
MSLQPRDRKKWHSIDWWKALNKYFTVSENKNFSTANYFFVHGPFQKSAYCEGKEEKLMLFVWA